jgi:hypothetical protein
VAEHLGERYRAWEQLSITIAHRDIDKRPRDA